jgi:release factor glutamine methyltransferase
MTAPLRVLLASTAERLSTCSDSPQLDAQRVLAHVLDRPRTWLLAHSNISPDSKELAHLEPLIRRLEHGEPLPYVLGHQEFFDLDFDLTPDVLIPRPETELLVERALTWLRASPGRSTVADVGTGSGCIAICLAVHVPNVRVLATDLSRSAIKVALGNARKYSVEPRIDFLECDMLPKHTAAVASDWHFDLVCANLPYIPTDTLHGLTVFRREPALALDGGRDGLDLFRRLFKLLPEWVAPGGCILLEIEATRGATTISLAYDALANASIQLHQDLAGRDRLLEIQLPGH